MEEAIRSAVAKAVEKSAAALIGTLTPAASPVPSSSSSTPTSRNMISRIHVKARWLIRMLAWVGATLDDAEDMDITDESIRAWLRQLQEVADAAEDLLDEFPREVLRLGFVGDGGWTAGSITELPKERKMTSEMDRLRDQRMEDIVSRFMKIKKPEQAWKPDYRKEQMNAESISARRTTSSVIEQPHIVGRDEELAKVKQFFMAGGKSCLIPSDIRHLSINPTSDSRGTIIPSIKDIPDPNFFRSYVLPGINRYVSIFERVRRSDSYTRMEHLRVLDLGGAGPRRLPKSIAHLKHLRYLRISNLIEELPEFVGSMHHLQTLDLEGPYQLPNSMSNLHNLRHIKLGSDVIEYPVGIGKLTDLQTLPGFRVSPKHNHAKLGELKDMNNIRGEFSIEGLDNLASVNEAKKACLDKKRNISYLRLDWDHEADSSPIDEEVLESLKPSVKLRSLKISGFKGPSYPSWLGDLSFSRLHTIKLEHCGNWASLPPLGKLPSLKSLYISEAGAVEYIGGEFFSGGFPQLEELTLEDMYNWKSWCGAREGDCPKLKKLSISSCENLESLSLINLGAVEVLFISECPELRFLPGDSLELSHLQHVQKITVQGIYQVGCIEAAHFFTAAPLEDQPCLILDSVGQREAEYMLGLRSSICRLTVRWCWNLRSLPLGNLSALEYVEISECPQLRITSVYPQLQLVPSLKKICVHRIHDAEIIAVLFEKSHLELENVDQLMASFLLKELSHMIRRLTVIRCANLTSLPLMELAALKYLEISECNQLQLSSGSLQLPQSSSMLEMNIQ
ncbi:hypothetical protein Taro_056092, partial [Colocasia esculenta]|nr:hypothetical protein [Colocasia esculenta]